MLDSERDHTSEGLAAAAETYVRQAFGETMHVHRLMPTKLPHFLLDRYRFWSATLLGRPAILMAAKNIQQGASADYLKHRDLIRRMLDVQLVVILLDRAPTALRRQMVDRQIAFLVPDAQLYIPEALLDLRERGGGGPSSVATEHVSPTAQILVLGTLLGHPIEDANLTQLADRYRAAIMSMSRALDELERLGVAKAHHVGRQRRLRMKFKGRELWDFIEPRLQSPVRKMRTVHGVLPDKVTLLASESALAHYTMLAAPRIPHLAMPATRWKQIQETANLKVGFSFDDTDRIELETWSYDPKALVDGPIVDRLSLYLTVRGDRDERVAQAADQLLEQFAW